MFDLTNFLDSAKEKGFGELIDVESPIYFYYENQDLINIDEFSDSINSLRIHFGFHSGMNKKLQPKIDKYNFLNASPLMGIERMSILGNNFMMQFLHKNYLVSPEFNSTGKLKYNKKPDKYYLFLDSERKDFGDCVYENLKKFDFLKNVFSEIHFLGDNRNICLAEGINYLFNLFDSYKQEKIFYNKEVERNS